MLFRSVLLRLKPLPLPAASLSSRRASGPYLLVLLQGGVQLLGQVVGHVGHPRLLLTGSTHAALVLTGLLAVLLLGVLAVSGRALLRGVAGGLGGERGVSCLHSGHHVSEGEEGTRS